MSLPRVLVVDDEPSVLALLARMLELHGYDVATAATCGDAVREAEARVVHAVILDLTLKGESSGLDLLRWLRAQPRYAETPVLILTGAVAMEDEEEEIIRRHDAYVFYKPQQYRSVIEYLERLVPEHEG